MEAVCGGSQLPMLLKPLQIERRHGNLHSGGTSRASRRSCVISAALSEHAADTKCQFSGLYATVANFVQRLPMCGFGHSQFSFADFFGQMPLIIQRLLEMNHALR